MVLHNYGVSQQELAHYSILQIKAFLGTQFQFGDNPGPLLAEFEKLVDIGQEWNDQIEMISGLLEKAGKKSLPAFNPTDFMKNEEVLRLRGEK